MDILGVLDTDKEIYQSLEAHENLSRQAWRHAMLLYPFALVLNLFLAPRSTPLPLHKRGDDPMS